MISSSPRVPQQNNGKLPVLQLLLQHLTAFFMDPRYWSSCATTLLLTGGEAHCSQDQGRSHFLLNYLSPHSTEHLGDAPQKSCLEIKRSRVSVWKARGTEHHKGQF